MPAEDRYIVFDYNEIYKAVRIRNILEDQEPPPDGTISDIVFNDSKTKAATVTIEFSTIEGQNKSLEYSREFFALALVFYCQGHNIPIPRAGKKEISCKDDTIIMRIRI